MPPQVADLIPAIDALVNVRASSKQRILEKLAHRAAQSLGVDPAVLLRALLRREELGSTGLGAGVALPHARLPGVRKPYALLATLAVPIDFDAVDDGPVHTILLLVLPDPSEADGLNALAFCARRLRDAKTVARLRRITQPEVACRMFAGGDQSL